MTQVEMGIAYACSSMPWEQIQAEGDWPQRVKSRDLHSPSRRSASSFLVDNRIPFSFSVI